MHHRFGGDWTTRKLDILAGYLRSYNTVLRNKPMPSNPFQRYYIDAFAGTGYRELPSAENGWGSEEDLLFPDLATEEPQQLLDGSARLALRVRPRFDRFVFIEQRADRCAHLELLKEDFPHLAPDIDIQQGDANEKIRKLCEMDWRSRRAVLFLDPYGMQVEWPTLEAIASTKAVDLWLLFPLGMGVNRMLPKSGEVPDTWRRRLNLLLGTEDWYEDFYRRIRTPALFGEEETVIKASTETIGRYFNDRLKTVFAGVADNPGVLRNSVRNPLYLLCFAVANERGKLVALQIANHLLKELS